MSYRAPGGSLLQKGGWITTAKGNSMQRIITPPDGSLLQKVADLIIPITDVWDQQLVNNYFYLIALTRDL